MAEKLYSWIEAAPAATAASDNSKPASAEVSSTPTPTEPWTAEQRLTKFYEKYVREKVSDVPKLLEKYSGKEEKLFTALTSKYGPEPVDPYLAAKWGIGEADVDEGDDHEGMAAGVSGIRLAQQAATAKVASGIPTEEGADAGEGGEKKVKARGASAKTAKKVNTRVIIQKISRQRKKAVTIVVGMDTVPDLKLKDAAQAFRKKFAGSSSVKDTATGGKEIVIQGDHQEACAKLIVEKFKVPKKCVFIDLDGEIVGVE
jgi:density-regulated protein DRP1